MHENKENIPDRIFVIGYMGSNRLGTAEKIADELGYTLINLDALIEKKEKQSIKRICMLMGEHQYRNKEYEVLEIIALSEKVVVACGDGIVLDDMCRAIIQKNEVVFVDDDIEVLWENAKKEINIPYAFMLYQDDSIRYRNFCKLYESRKPLYNQCINNKGGQNHDL